MKKTIHLLITTLALLQLLLLSSCQNDSDFSDENFKTQDDVLVECVNGVLRFSSGECFLKVLNEVANMNELERKSWEQNLGFVSQYSLLDQAYSEIDKVSSEDALADILARNDDIIFINSDNEVAPRMSFGQYSRIINRQGYFYVGEILHKVTDDFLFVAKKVGEQTLEPYISEGEKSNDIYVLKNEKNLLTKLGYGTYQEAGYIDDKRMVKIYMSTYKVCTYDGYWWYCHDYVDWTIKGFKKVLGVWYSYNTLYTYKDVSFVVKSMYDTYYDYELEHDYTSEEPWYANFAGSYPGPVSTTVESKSHTWSAPIGDLIQSTYNNYPSLLDAPYFVSVYGKAQSRGTESGWAIINCP